MRQLCDRLSIGESKAKELIKSGAIRVVRIGRSVRISDSEIARFINEREGARNA
jgi:excisionase family DNA binding protein